MGFIEQIAPYVQLYAPKYGIKVCSPIIAQAILESASGTSELAVNCHNYFGLKYRQGRCPTAYSTPYYKIGSEQNPDGSYVVGTMAWFNFPNMNAGVHGYFDFINVPNYANLKGVTDPRTYLENIKKDGYATSINYVNNLMGIINKYNLTKYDTTSVIPAVPKDFVVGGVDYKYVFDPKYYADKYPDLKQAFGYNQAKLFQHFLTCGMKETRQAKNTFNVVVYRNRYPDLQKAFASDWPSYYKHYCVFGYKEGRTAV